MGRSDITEVVERITPNKAPALVHILSTCCAPWTRTLCGKPHKSGPRWNDMDRENCVVCIELEKSTHRCPRCGTKLMHRRRSSVAS